MHSSIGALDIVVIVLMMLISAAMGIYFHFTGGRQKTIDEFLMGGRKMMVFPVSFSLMATTMSAVSILGIPAEIYMYGTQNVTFIIGFVMAGPICAYGFLPTFFKLNIGTAYEYLEKRFGRTMRTIAAALFILQTIFYMAVVLYAPSIALNAVTGLSMWVSVISIAAVSTFYCTLGGLRAVLWTDVFQSALMYTTLLAVIIAGSYSIGFSKVFTLANEGGRLIFFNLSADLTDRYTLWNSLCYGLYLGVADLCSSQSEIQRLLSVGNLRKSQLSAIFGGILMALFNLFCYWCGIVVYAVYRNCDPMLDPASHLDSQDQMIPYIILQFFKDVPGLSGLCIAGIFSGALSTISSAVNSLTSVTVEDFIKTYFHRNLTESVVVIIAKTMVIVYGCLCLLLTYVVANFRGVMEASSIMNGMIAGPILGVFIVGMFSKTINQKGMLIGLAAGTALSSWIGVGSYIVKVPIPTLQQSTNECPAALNATINMAKIYNETFLMDFKTEQSISEIDHFEEKYIFPLYKVAFQWVPVFGCITTIIVGSLSSLLISYCCKNPNTHQTEVNPLQDIPTKN